MSHIVQECFVVGVVNVSVTVMSSELPEGWNEFGGWADKKVKQGEVR